MIETKALTDEELLKFTATLSILKELDMCRNDFDLIAAYINSDGCSGVVDIYWTACIAHDYRYATGRDFDGTPITRAEADRLFRLHIQHRSMFGVLSPVSWWRWLGVRILGRNYWKHLEEK